MALTNVLFKMLAKVNDEDFLAEHEKILNSECSLKAFIEEDNTHKQVEKVSSVLSILADYKPIESIRQEQPGKFEYNQLKKYIGADIKNGVNNEQAVLLDAYFKQAVDNTEDGQDDTINVIDFMEYDDIVNLFSENDHFEKIDIVVLNMMDDSKDVCFDMVNNSLLSRKSYYARLIVFPDELHQFEVMSFLRNQGLDKDVKIFPLIFHCKPTISGDVCDNVLFGVLFGRFSVLLPPINVYHNTIENIRSILQSISPPRPSVAVIADPKAALVQVHSKSLASGVTYYGLAAEIDKFEQFLQRNSKSQFVNKDRSSNDSMGPSPGEVRTSGSEDVDVNRNSVKDSPSTAVMTIDQSSTSPFKTPSRKVAGNLSGSGRDGKDFLERINNVPEDATS